MYLRFLSILSARLGQVNEIFAVNLGTWYYSAWWETVLRTMQLVWYYTY
jgi:hypothetical protein